MLVAPSILSADFNKLLEEVKTCSSAEFLHIDVMDGHFVPNISFGPTVYKNLKKNVFNILDVHLMISDPMKYLDDHVKAGADIFTFHYEAVDDVSEMISEIKKRICLARRLYRNTCIHKILQFSVEKCCNEKRYGIK